MQNVEINNGYIPIRSSVRTEQTRLIAAIDDLEKRLAQAEEKSEQAIDPSFARLAYVLKQKLNSAQEQLQTFDKKHRELDARRSSSAAKNAVTQAVESAEKFERALLAAASAAAALTADAADLASVLHVVDPGLWPSGGSVNDAIRSRVITVFGNLSTIKLPGYGSTGKTSEPLTKRFELI